jgi:hypothetical protein
MNEQIKKNIEKNFLKIRGFDKWEDYDLIQASSKDFNSVLFTS